MSKIFTSVMLLSIFAACAPKIRTHLSQKYPPLAYNESVVVVGLKKPTPPGELLGTVKVGDSGLTVACELQTVLEKAKEEARKAGGNVIKIIAHKTPDFGSSCHRITVEVLRVAEEHLARLSLPAAEADPAADPAYATLFVYRAGGTAPLVSYNLYLGDSLICRVTNRFRREIKIATEGEVSLWAKTEAKSTLPMLLAKGKTYYVKCGVAMGVMVGRPTLQLVDPQEGRHEYLATKPKQ